MIQKLQEHTEVCDRSSWIILRKRRQTRRA